MLQQTTACWLIPLFQKSSLVTLFMNPVILVLQRLPDETGSRSVLHVGLNVNILHPLNAIRHLVKFLI